MTMEYVTRQNDYDALLGCQDNRIRIISGSNLAFDVPTNGPVMALCSLHGEENKIQRASTSLLYGTNIGTLTSIQIPGNISGDVALNWTVLDPNKVSISSVKAVDLTQDGIVELVVARDDGRLDVYGNDPSSIVPVKVFGRDIGESIRGIDVGRVNSPDYNEIVVAAYSGKIMSYTSEPTQQRAPDDTYGRSVQTVNNENRIKSLKKELDALKAKVDKEKSNLKKAQQKSSVDTSKSLVVDFPINSNFALNVDEAAYSLTLEIQVNSIILPLPQIICLRIPSIWLF